MSRKASFFDRGLEYVEFLRANPILAVEEILAGFNTAQLPVLPAPQRMIFKDMWFKPYVLVTAGRGTGKSYLLSIFAVTYALLYPGVRVGLLSASFRQAKIIFSEVTRRYAESPILREATVKRPVVASDRCYLDFRSVNNSPGSLIAAIPMGDGGRIRGQRFHALLIDEFAQVPEDIFDTVIRPMGATTLNPMENVRRLKRLKTQLVRGELTQLEYDGYVSGGTSNKIIAMSSAYFQFNHMYKRILSYDEQIERGSNKYATHFISYLDMPEGFLDQDNIDEAKTSMSRILFSMEYSGNWESDSDGVFKASLLESTKSSEVQIQLEGKPQKQYVMGIDPARSSDAFAIVIIEIGNPSSVVHAFQATRNKFPDMARKIYEFCDKFNVVLADMDAGAGGGGVAIKDILASEMIFPKNMILDMDDEDYINVPGRKILRMFNPNPKSLAESNYNSLNLLEQNRLKFPFPPRDLGKILDAKEKIYENIRIMLRQMMSITVTETKSGMAHFDIPATGKSSRKKDLYSAFILACGALYNMVYDRPDNTSPIHEIGGIVRKREKSFSDKGMIPNIHAIMKLPV